MRTELGVDALRLSVTAMRYGNGPRRLSSQLRQQGPQAAHTLYEQLTVGQRADIDSEAKALRASGIDGVLLGMDSYPTILACLRQAPPVLFYQGNSNLLGMGSIGICGSQDASSQGMSAAAACGEEIAKRGLVVVSGYARGVDTEAHAAALGADGCTVLVLAEGIGRFKVKRWLAAKPHDASRVTVVSQFPPKPNVVGGWRDDAERRDHRAQPRPARCRSQRDRRYHNRRYAGP